jgi:hypothetical protein
MPIKNDSLNRKLYDLLNARGYDPVPRDSDVSNAGKTVPPEEADVFKFTFKQGNKSIDEAWVSVDGAENLTLYYDQDLANKADERTPGTQFDDSWYGLLRHLKKWAHARQLSFKLEPKEKIDSDMAQRTYMKKKEKIAEGYYPMGKSASYSDAVPTVKIILQHTRQVQEGEQRYRNVAKIFLENAQGERFLSPTSKPGLAQVYARHLAEGGVPNDDRWNHLKSLCEEYSKMAGFVRAVRSNQFNESAQRVVEAGLNHYQSLRESLGKLRGHRGYTSYFESYTPPLMEDDTDSNTLNELFVQETLDPRIESVMPILNKLSKNLGEMKEISELAEWADNLLEGGDGGEASEEPVQQIEEAPGAETLAHNQSTEKSRLDAFDLDEGMLDGSDEYDNPVANAITRRILLQRVDLLAKHGPEKVAQAIGDVAEFVGDVDEIGSSDVSGWIKQIEQSLGGVDEGIGDVAKKVGSALATGAKAVGKAIVGKDDDELLKDLQKKAGVRGMNHGKPSMAISDVEKRVDEEDMDESALQAYLGNKKYGKEGMDALRKAGRDDASKEEMTRIRDKYNKLDEEGEFAGDYATGEAGQWRNKGPKANKPATIGDLVGENFINTDAQAVVTEVDTGEYDARKSTPKGETTPDQEKEFRKKIQAYGKELEQRQKEKVKEGHDDLAAMMRIINR